MFTGLLCPSRQMPEHCLKEATIDYYHVVFQLIHHFSSHNLRSRTLPCNFVSKLETRFFNEQKIRNIHLSQRCCCFEFTNKTTGGSIDLSERIRFLWSRLQWNVFSKIYEIFKFNTSQTRLAESIFFNIRVSYDRVDIHVYWDMTPWWFVGDCLHMKHPHWYNPQMYVDVFSHTQLTLCECLLSGS